MTNTNWQYCNVSILKVGFETSTMELACEYARNLSYEYSATYRIILDTELTPT